MSRSSSTDGVMTVADDGRSLASLTTSSHSALTCFQATSNLTPFSHIFNIVNVYPCKLFCDCDMRPPPSKKTALYNLLLITQRFKLIL